MSSLFFLRCFRLISETSSPSRFVEAKVQGEVCKCEGGVTIVLTNGRRIMIGSRVGSCVGSCVGSSFDRRLLLEVVEALESGVGARS